MSKVLIKNISKSYGEKKVISNFSLDIENKEKIAIMGESGSGKTTLIRILAGLEKQDSGEINGIPEKISFIFQEDRLCEDFSVISNIRFAVPKTVSEKKIIDCLEKLGLKNEINKKVSDLSGGMKRRVAIARALLFDSEFLIMDEPFKGLDQMLKLEVMKFVKSQTINKTVILVTHDTDEALFLSERIIKI